MIQSVSPTSLPSLMPVDSLLQTAPAGTEPADFGALLASSLPAAATPQPAEVLAALPAQTEAAVPEAAIAAAATGNILPPALPVLAALDSAATAQTPAEPDDLPANAAVLPASAQALKPQHRHGAVKPAPATSRRDAPRKDSEHPIEQTEAPTVIVSEAAPAAQPTAGPAAGLRPVPIAATQLASSLAAEQDSRSEAEQVHGSPTPRLVPARAEPSAQALAQAAPQAAFRRSAPDAAPAAAPQTQTAASAPAEAKPASPPVLRVEIAQSSAAPSERPAETRPALRRAATSETAFVAASTLSADLPASQLAAVPPSAAAPVSAEALRPHDFAALVDRLVAAREAVQPRAATLTVAHAEFGPVELRFRHEERGLAVSLSSADPDFARAATAAPQVFVPPTTAAPSSEAGQGAPQRDGPATNAGSSGSQPRGQQGERRGETAQHFNHGARNAPQAGTRRSGVFA